MQNIPGKNQPASDPKVNPKIQQPNQPAQQNQLKLPNINNRQATQEQPNAQKATSQKVDEESGISGFFNKAGRAVSNVFKKEKTVISDTDTRVNTEFSTSRHQSNEAVADDLTEDDKLRKEEELLKTIFKAKEVRFQNNIDDITQREVDQPKSKEEVKLKDRDGRIMLHRIALEQKPAILRETLATIDVLLPGEKSLILETKDRYGNTPLLLCTIFNHANRKQQRLECMQILFNREANANVQNPTTQFTPLHWASIHGDEDLVKMLLEYSALEYIPDKEGKFPIDYAGQFKHGKVCELLIQRSKKRLEEWRLKSPTLRDQELSRYVSSLGVPGVYAQNYDNPLLLFSPIYQTVLLYWGCMFNEVHPQVIRDIMGLMECYPEAPVLSQSNMTPCHAAAQVGNQEKLKDLLSDIQRRYVISQDIPNQRREKLNICTDFPQRWATLMKQSRYLKLRNFTNTVFTTKMNEYKSMLNFNYDFKDLHLNTPLHLASQYGHADCTWMLLNDYKLSLDCRNQLGWMPRDLQQHDKVRRAYFEYYKLQDEQTIKEDNEALSRGSQIVAQPPEVLVQPKNTADEKAQIQQEMIKCREYMPQIPQMALKVNVGGAKADSINRIVSILQEQGFIIQMFPTLVPDQFYIALQLKRDRLEAEAKQMKLRLKLNQIDAKIAFEPSQKVLFEPFRAKDIQKVMLAMINNIINTEVEMQRGNIIQILPMHDFQGQYEIKSKWESKWLVPLTMLGHYYRESIKFQFSELSAIKNYFGEKIAFHFAWMAFFTSWLMIPAILGLAMTIYQGIYAIDNVLNGLYALLVCIWVTIFIERWKRKSSEIALRWGIYSDSKEYEKQLRPEFNGDEQFSNISMNTQKKNITARFYLFIILSIPIFIILIGLCIVIFFVTRYFREENLNGEPLHDRIVELVAGVCNGMAISIINKTYQLLVIVFLKLENHKYSDTYEKSFIFKLFLFKFVNTNLSLFYTAFNNQNFDQLYYLLVGLIIQKGVEMIFFKTIYNYLQFAIFRRRYFKRMQALAVQQQLQHQNFIRDLDAGNKQVLAQRQSEIQSKSIFVKIYNTLKPTPVYQRLVLNTQSKSADEQQVLIDYVELNSVMPIKLEKTEIMEISDIFIMFGLATMYACACPIACFMVLVYNLFDIKFDLRTRYTCLQRPFMQIRANIGPWLSLAEFTSLAAVISNSCLLYFSSPLLRAWLADTFDIQVEAYTLWVFVGIEHAIILIKVISAEMIQDTPLWVRKSLSRVKAQVDKIEEEEKDKEENQNIEAYLKRFRENELKNKQVLGNIKKKVKSLIEELAKKDEMLKGFEAERAKMEAEAKNKTSQILREIEKEKAQKKPEDLKLLDFIGIRQSEWFGQERAIELEKSLSRSFMQRLFKSSFYSIEKEILARRIGKLYSTKSSNTVNCAQCSITPSVLECFECQDHFCKSCSDVIHSKQVLSLHMLAQLPITIDDQNKMTIVKAVGQKQNQGLKPMWKKFEYFNIPLDPGNDSYQYVQKQFVYLKQQYIGKNFIANNDQIDYQGYFIDGNYDLLTDIQGSILKKKLTKTFGDGSPIVAQDDKFNDEELFYMNRIAYYLFKHKYENLTFSNFVMRLKILQSSQYQKRLTFWLSILDLTGNELISSEDFDKILKISYAQDLNQKFKLSDITDLVFGSDVKVRQDTITINKMIEILNREGPVKELMQCILQYNPSEVIDV